MTIKQRMLQEPILPLAVGHLRGRTLREEGDWKKGGGGGGGGDRYTLYMINNATMKQLNTTQYNNTRDNCFRKMSCSSVI